MASQIDYETVDVPDDKTPPEYTYAERRAEILELIREAGHPRRVKQSQLAKRYDCTVPNISNDMSTLAEYFDNSLGDRRVMGTQTVLERSIEGLLEEEEWRKAAQTALEMDEWIRENKELEEMMERIEQIEEQRERAKYR